MNPVVLITASGSLLALTAWLLNIGWLFWVGVALCAITLFLNIASGAMKLPVLPVMFMGVAAAFQSPWYFGLGVGLVIWTALESAGEFVSLLRARRQ